MCEQQCAACVEPVTVLGIESCQFRAIQIKNAKQSPSLQQGHHDFGTGRRITRNMPRKCVDIGHQESFPALRGSAADAATERNPHAGGLALKRPQHQFLALEEIEPDPVQFWQSVIQNRAHIRRVRETIGLTGKKPGEPSVQLSV